tara:strand:+ start:206 stop:1015 length:810 start_codon:yes stop_codon:yes gene_type:complete
LILATPLEEEPTVSRALDYETKVFDIMKSAMIDGLDVGSVNGAGFSNQGAGDIEATYRGEQFNIEVKLDMFPQMGGTSIRIDSNEKTCTLVQPDAVDADAIPFFMKAAKVQDAPLKVWVDFIRKQEPKELHSKVPYTIPFGSVTKEAWIAAKNAGLLKEMNATRSFPDAKNIAKAYNRKNVYYIQIGGAGLFYLGKNPLRLPVPELKGAIDVEFRLGASGSKVRTIGDKTYRVVGAGYRCQGRLKSHVKSRYSLDNVNDLHELFEVKSV